MYLLVFYQDDYEKNIGLFASENQARKFVEQIPGYNKRKEVYMGYEYIYETINPKEFDDYFEIKFNGHLYPFTIFSFNKEKEIVVEYRQIPNLSNEGNGLVEGFTKVDAYSIENIELKKYIDKREGNYKIIKNILESNGYDVDRNFYGSEDGEAIVYKKNGDIDWSILTHMDPSFVDEESVISEIIGELIKNKD